MISASWVARISGMSHWCSVQFEFSCFSLLSAGITDVYPTPTLGCLIYW
jgi:hypothetical protein